MKLSEKSVVIIGSLLFFGLTCPIKAETGESNKFPKCSFVGNQDTKNFLWYFEAVETIGPWCKEAESFLNVIGKNLIAESGDLRSKQFFFQRLSLAIQRGNAASIRGTTPPNTEFDKAFIL